MATKSGPTAKNTKMMEMIKARVKKELPRLRLLTEKELLAEIGQTAIGADLLNPTVTISAGKLEAAGTDVMGRDFWKDLVCTHRTEINDALTPANVAVLAAFIVPALGLTGVVVSIAITIAFWIIQQGVTTFCTGWTPPPGIQAVQKLTKGK